MAEPFNFELTLTDFLKYMPEAKRHDYELMLRRCNFSDPADPMFPVMLFLLFFQDNLADRMEELTEEVKAQKTIPPTDHTAAAPERKSCWEIVVAVLMAVQLMLTIFGIFCLTFRDFPSQPIMNPAISHSSEIQKINHYWDAKLQYAQKGNFCMNRLDLIPDIIGASALGDGYPAEIHTGGTVLVGDADVVVANGFQNGPPEGPAIGVEGHIEECAAGIGLLPVSAREIGQERDSS